LLPGPLSTDANVASNRKMAPADWRKHRGHLANRRAAAGVAGRVFGPQTCPDLAFEGGYLRRIPWSRTGQCIFYGNGDEKLAVSDAMIVSTSTLYQQTPGTILAGSGAPVDPDATYLVKTATHMIWPYDDRGRLIGEDVWEYDDSVREFIPLDPIDVLTAEQSGKLLAPLIKPLPTHNPFTA
jgi:hypothetical protein